MKIIITIEADKKDTFKKRLTEAVDSVYRTLNAELQFKENFSFKTYIVNNDYWKYDYSQNAT